MMPKNQITIRKNKFRIWNDVWDGCGLAYSESLAWAASHLVFWKHHARPIEKPAQSAKAQENNTLAFTCSLVALHAKLAQHKGSLSADAFLEFRCLFPVGDAESQNLRSLFKMAWDDDESLASHIQRMVRCYPSRADLFTRALEGLARHMLADGRPDKANLTWLNNVASEFGIHRLQMRHIIHQAQLPLEARPYALFDISKRATTSQIKMAYKRFMQRCHPDQNTTADLPETRMASERMSRAGNVAYKKLKR